MAVTIKTVEPHPKKLAISGVLALVAAYIFASLAIDRGNWFYYGMAVVGILYGLRNLWRAASSFRK